MEEHHVGFYKPVQEVALSLPIIIYGIELSHDNNT